MQFTGIILAGGKSSRMGTDKALLEIEGKTLLIRAVEFCRLFCSQVIISSNLTEHEIEGIKRVADIFENCGPLGGIYSCLKQSENDWNFVLSVDAAFVEPDFITFLTSKTKKYDAVIPVHKNGKEPLIALYNKRTLSQFKLQLEKKEYKMHFLLEKVKVNFVDSNQWTERYPKLFHNINYPEDLNLR